jgi:hypothetical protein
MVDMDTTIVIQLTDDNHNLPRHLPTASSPHRLASSPHRLIASSPHRLIASYRTLNSMITITITMTMQG